MTPPPAKSASSRSQQLVLWILWFAFLNGIILFRVFLAKKGTSAGADALPWMISLVPAGLSAILRWVFLPRVSDVRQGLISMVIGVALAEATCLLGIFVTPSHLNLLVLVSFMAVFQFAPTWADRFFPPADEAAIKPPLR